jgi:phage-related protein
MSSPPSSASIASRARSARWPESPMAGERTQARAPARAASTDAAVRRPAAEPAGPRRGIAPSGPPVLRLVTGSRTVTGVRDESLDDLLRSPGAGAPLPEATRRQLEASFRVDLSSVQVHSDSRARRIVDRLRARAFTFGRRIFLGAGELPTDAALMAHEAAHVVQQRGRPVVQMATATPSPFALEREADRASTAVQRGEPATVIGRTNDALIQRQERLGTIESGPVPAAEESEGWLEARIWGLLGGFATEMRRIARIGIVAYLREQITGALHAALDRLLEPIRPILAAMAFVRSQFTSFTGWMREAGEALGRNDCGPITVAMQRVKDVVDGVLTTIKEKIEAVWTKVKTFFSDLWDRFGAPIWDTLKAIGGAAWEKIKDFGTWLWDKTEPVRSWIGRAWTWLKNKLGIGEGEEGQDGLLQWVKGKAAEAWDWLKPKIEPYKKQIMIAAGIFLLFTPAGPFVAFFAGVQAFRTAVQWFRDNAQKKNAVVDQRSFLQRTVIPGLRKGAEMVTSGLRTAVSAVSAKLGAIASGLAETVSGLQTSVVAFLADAVAWIQAQAQSLAEWATTQLSALGELVSAGLARLKAFLQPVLDFLGEIGAVVIDIFKLPIVVAGKLWKLIPACIRDPFVNFLIEQVVKKIPLFKTVTETIPAIWTRIKDTALGLIRKVFREGDFKGALVDVLRLVLDALGIPLDLFTAIFEKSAALIDTVMEDPGKFLTNVLMAIKTGFVNFGTNILSHLAGGIKDWLFSALEDANIQPPADFTLRSIFTFALDVLGISVETVLQRLEEKFGKDRIRPVRTGVRVISEVWSWFGTLMEGGPDAVWRRLGEKASDLWSTILGSVSNWILVQVAKQAAKTLASLAAAPVGTVIKVLGIIYDTIKSVVKYLKRLLEIANGVLDMGTDIAHGAIEGGAALVERLLEKSLGVAIGFLAQYVGLGDLSERIADTVEAIREKVIGAIDYLIEKVRALVEKGIGLFKSGIAKIREWWTASEPFRVGKDKHTLHFKGEGADAQLVVESTPLILDDYLKTHTLTGKQKTEVGKHKKIIDDLKKKTGGSFGKTDGETIAQSLAAIAKALGTVPQSKITFTTRNLTGYHDPVALEMVAAPLSLDPDPSQQAGSEPRQNSDFWLKVSHRVNSYVKGHLLNHHVHGPGIHENLVPIPIDTNNKMERDFEDKVKKHVLGEGAVLEEYRVKANFTRKTGRKYLAAEDLIPLNLTLTATYLDANNKKQSLFSDSNLDVDLPADTRLGFVREYVDLSNDKATRIDTIPGVGPVLAAEIVKKQPFRTYEDLRLVPGLPDWVVDDMKDDPYVKLFSK